MTHDETDSSSADKRPGGQCPSWQRLEALIRSAGVPEIEQVQLEQHVAACESCRRRLEELAGWGPAMDGLLSRRGAGPVSSPESNPGVAQPGAPIPLDFLSTAERPGYLGKLGPYDILEVVGQGGMGVVLKAHDPSLDRIVAVKVLSRMLAASGSARPRFIREARAAAAVIDPNVMTIHAVDEANGVPYLVMEFLGGCTLEKLIRDGGAMRLEQIQQIGAQIASGLAAAHAQGVVHRDIKPANIMLESDSGGAEGARVKITDFGLARAVDDAAITLSGHVTGTPQYMAPEQARGQRSDHRADLFSLGCVLYAMCTGHPPFAGSMPLLTLRSVCEDNPRPILDSNPRTPQWLVDVIDRLMCKDPAKRYGSAREVMTALSSSEHPPATVTAAATTPGAGRVRRMRATMAAVILILAVGAGSLLLVERLGFTNRRDPTWSDRQRGDVEALRSAMPAAATEGPNPSASAGAGSVTLASADGTVRTFDTLAEAIVAAASGDSIELQWDGRVRTRRIDIGRKALLLRAGEGRRPILSQESFGESILRSEAALVLEGIEFEGESSSVPDVTLRGGEMGEALIVVSGSPLLVANCRFATRMPLGARFGCLRLANRGNSEIRNTELHALRGPGIQWVIDDGGAGAAAASSALRLHNCIHSGRVAFYISKAPGSAAGLQISQSSMRLVGFFGGAQEETGKGLSVDFSHSVVEATAMDLERRFGRDNPGIKPIEWSASRCIFDIGRPGTADADNSVLSTTTAGSNADINDLSPRLREGDSFEAEVRFEGDVRRRTPRREFLAGEDFALRSATLANGRTVPRRVLSQLGAQIERVGAGAAYEAYRKSSDYLQWRQQTETALHSAR